MHGITSMIVCCKKDVTDKQILEVYNKDNPSGTINGWMEVVRNDKKYPNRNPVDCKEHSNRLHFIVNC